MSQREEFIRCAMAQVGKRYVWATAGPETFDCSGLVAYCYQQATGKAITRSSYDQIHLGQNVSAGHLAQPGDLAFWDTEHNGTAGHVGIVVAGGEVVSALNPTQGVRESESIYANFGGPFVGARRLFADAPDPKAPSMGALPGPPVVVTPPPADRVRPDSKREQRRDNRRFRQRARDQARQERRA